jgi:hypothetical protein
MKTRRRLLTALAVLALLAASCGDDDGDDATPSETTTTTTATTTTADTSSTDTTSTDDAPTSTTSAPDAGPSWVSHPGGPECMCADGSDYWIHSRDGDPDKVVLYFQGGGACFTEGMCDFEDGTYKVTTGEDDNPGDDGTGIFEFDNPDNPLADWSFVFVPYCTGDVFLGDATTTYGEITVEHNGFENAMYGLDFVIENYGDASQLLVTGSSAGGVPAPLFGGLASDRLPDDTDIAVLADASGGYATNPLQNQVIGNLWGTTNNVPDWSVFDGVPPEEYGIPDLYRFAGNHAPEIRMARFDNAFDGVQVSFSAMAGLEGGLLEVLDFNETLTEDNGVDLDVYVAPGDDHTVLGRPEVYTMEVEGVAFVDWLTEFVDGGAPGDVRCTDCGGPAEDA